MKNRKGNKRRAKCGIIMPISEQTYAGLAYSCEYWNSLKQFLCDAIKFSGFEPQPMWEDPNESSITPRIIKNIKESPLALCVISACNPNVMIELGMRLFAEKPVLVIYDDSIRRLPFDINDLEAYRIPYRPLYAEYAGIKSEIRDRLSRMSKPGYRTYLSRYKNQVSTAPHLSKREGDWNCETQIGPTGVDKRTISAKTLLGQRLSLIGPSFPLGPTGESSDGALVN